MFLVRRLIFVCVFMRCILLNVWVIEMCLYLSVGVMWSVLFLLLILVIVSFLNLCCDFFVGVRIIWLFGFYVIVCIKWSFFLLIFVVIVRCVYVIGMCRLWRLSVFLWSVIVFVLKIGIFCDCIWLCKVIVVFLGKGLFFVFILRVFFLVMRIFLVCKWRDGLFILNISFFFWISINFRIGVFMLSKIVCFFFIMIILFVDEKKKRWLEIVDIKLFW